MLPCNLTWWTTLSLAGNATIKPGCVQLPNITAVPSLVKYGTAAANLTRNVTGSQTAYTQLYTPYFGESADLSWCLLNSDCVFSLARQCL